jgi:molybdopterin-guanine dinucleotide biosynthesis protein A
VIGAILAGGASSRFGGEPKGLQRVGGIRIIDRVANALRSVASEILLVSNDSNATSWLPRVRVVNDVRAERGSLVGIHSALAAAGNAVIVVAWDMPFVDAELLGLISDRSRAERFATVPEGPGGIEPFCAMYTPACLPMIEAAIDADELRMSTVLGRFPSLTRIPVDDVRAIGDPSRLFFNVNDTADLALANQLSS